MPAICTLTLNPALDIATATDRVTATHKLRCTTARYDPGGGGINVARVVFELGGNATAVYTAGGPVGHSLRELLDTAGIPQVVVPIRGETRVNITVDERVSNNQFRFVFPGPELSPEEQEQCIEAVAKLDPKPEFLVASGSLPPGVPADFYARVARLAKSLGAKYFLDTSGDALREAGREGIYLVKPNLKELSEFAGRDLATRSDQIDAARELIAEGRAEVVVVSLGADGALLVTDKLAEHFPALQVPLRSAVGAGDSMLGGIVYSLARGNPLRDAVRYGIAAGAAALMTEGTELNRREDTERLYAEMLSEAG